MKNSETAAMPSGTVRRRRTRKTVPLRSVFAGIDGRLTNSQASVMAASGTTAKKAPRQPIYWPRKLPNGAAIVTASALPPLSRPSARGTWDSGTRRMTVAADIDQNPPMTTPTSARPAMKTAVFGAKATITPERIISQREAQQHRAAVDAARDAGDRQAGQDSEQPRDGDCLSGRSLAHSEVGGDGGQEADRHELGGDQRRRHRASARRRRPRRLSRRRWARLPWCLRAS